MIHHTPKPQFKGIWIPKAIWISNLSLLQKCLLAEIDSLDDDTGCFASNEYLANVFESTPESIRVTICKLKMDGWIVEWQTDGRRRLKSVFSGGKPVMPVTDSVMPVTETCNGHYEKEPLPLIQERKDQRRERKKDLVLQKDLLEVNPIPEELTEHWTLWKKHLKEKKKPLGPTAESQQIKKLLGVSIPHAIAMIEHSIASNWQGLFEPSKSNFQTREDRHEAARLELKNRDYSKGF